ncbi:MAG TPA: hypothetical protein DCX07_16010 [Phycisphaerales bacterium]|nr:hypothetical protein [Phycisphaerales bacterium]
MGEKSNGGFHYVTLPNGWEVGRFAVLEELEGLVHAVTTRRGPDPQTVRNAPSAAAAQLADTLNLRGAAFCEQVHGRTVLAAGSPGCVDGADGLVTNVASLGVMGRSADCPLLLVVDMLCGAVGMAHASWRGTAGRIASELVLRMACEYDSRPEDLLAVICPSAGPCCYEVGQDVQRVVVGSVGRHAERFFRPHKNGKLLFDLWAANRDELVHSGLEESNVHVAGVCTICSEGKYPSHRAEGDSAGRFAAVIARL